MGEGGGEGPLEIPNWTVGSKVATYVKQCLGLVGRPVMWSYIDEAHSPSHAVTAGFHYHAHGQPHFNI